MAQPKTKPAFRQEDGLSFHRKRGGYASKPPIYPFSFSASGILSLSCAQRAEIFITEARAGSACANVAMSSASRVSNRNHGSRRGSLTPAVQHRQRSQKLARQRGRYLHGVGYHQVAAHPCRARAQGRWCWRPRRTARSACRRGWPCSCRAHSAKSMRPPSPEKRKRGFQTGCPCPADDARRILPKRPQGVVQRPPIFLAAAGRVLSEPERQAVNLHVADIRLQRVAADQIRPRHRAEQPAARQPAGSGAVRMHDPAERPEFFPVGLAVPQPQAVPVFPQHLKPALRAEMEAAGRCSPCR